MRTFTLTLSALALVAGVSGAYAGNSGAPHIGGTQDGYNFATPNEPSFDYRGQRGLYEGRSAAIVNPDGSDEAPQRMPY